MASENGSERRRYPRHDAAIPVQLEVEVAPKDAETTKGTTINVSKGGMLVRLSDSLGVGSRCLIRFIGAEERISPQTTVGTVIRETAGREDFAIAFAFEIELALLSVHPGADKEPI